MTLDIQKNHSICPTLRRPNPNPIKWQWMTISLIFIPRTSGKQKGETRSIWLRPFVSPITTATIQRKGRKRKSAPAQQKQWCFVRVVTIRKFKKHCNFIINKYKRPPWYHCYKDLSFPLHPVRVTVISLSFNCVIRDNSNLLLVYTILVSFIKRKSVPVPRNH